MTKKHNSNPHERPKVVSVERKPSNATLNQRAYLRAAGVSQDQREARARREALGLLIAAEKPAPTIHEDLQATRRRPLDAPMATREPEELWPDRTNYDLAGAVPSLGIGRAVLTLLLMVASFIAGVAVWRG